MKRILLPFLSLVILGFQSGCKKENNPDPPEPQPEYILLAQQTIGPEGGTMNVANTFSLTVPPGAFTAASVIQVYSSDEANPYDENGASGVYYLKGIPGSFSKNLSLALSHTGLGQGESFLAIGQLSYTTGPGDTIFAPLFYPASDSSGFLVASIDADTKKSVTAVSTAPELNYGVPFYCVKNMQTAYSEHFLVRFPRDVAHLAGIDSLLKGLEGAFDLLHNWGFVYTKRDRWPLPVYIRRFKDTGVFGYSCWNALRTPNSGIIEVNTAHLHETETMRVTGAHEFFHIVQAFYTTDQKYLWLGEASSVWLESYFADDAATYVPSVFFENFFQSYYGLEWGASMAKKAEHGYGCASVIKYLMENNNATGNPNAVLKIWEATPTGNHPITLLLNSQTILQDWWDDYVLSFYTNKIYRRMTENFNDIYYKNQNYIDTIATSADLEKQFNHQAMDLSGRVFKVVITRNDMTDDTKCSVRLTGGSSSLYVFKIKGFAPVLLTRIGDGEEYLIPDIKELHDNGYDILLLYSNHAIDPANDYAGYRNISILFKMWESEHVYTIVSTEADGAPFDNDGVPEKDYALKCLDNGQEFGAGYRFVWTFGDGTGAVTLDGTNMVTHQWDAVDVYPVHAEIRLLADNTLVGEASELAVIEGQVNYLPLLHSIKHIAVSLPSNGHHYFNNGSVCSDYLFAQSDYLEASGGKISWDGPNFSVSGFYNNNWDYVNISGYVSADGDSLLYVKAIRTFSGGTGFSRDSLFMELVNIPLSNSSVSVPRVDYNLTQGNAIQSHVQSLYFKQMTTWMQWVYYDHSDWEYVSLFANFTGGR